MVSRILKKTDFAFFPQRTQTWRQELPFVFVIERASFHQNSSKGVQRPTRNEGLCCFLCFLLPPAWLEFPAVNILSEILVPVWGALHRFVFQLSGTPKRCNGLPLRECWELHFFWKKISFWSKHREMWPLEIILSLRAPKSGIVCFWSWGPLLSDNCVQVGLLWSEYGKSEFPDNSKSYGNHTPYLSCVNLPPSSTFASFELYLVCCVFELCGRYLYIHFFLCENKRTDNFPLLWMWPMWSFIRSSQTCCKSNKKILAICVGGSSFSTGHVKLKCKGEMNIYESHLPCARLSGHTLCPGGSKSH